MDRTPADKIIASRKILLNELPAARRADEAAEGGCGVLGFAANVPLAGGHVLAASRQMHNRGNGKGGGIAMAGLSPAQARVDYPTLRSHYMLQIALLDAQSRAEIEKQFIQPNFDIAQAYELDHLDDYRAVDGLTVRPPDVWRYFVRVKPQVLERFSTELELDELSVRALEDEFVFQNSFKLNRQFYASLGEKRAFVLSHGRNLSVVKIVGYAEDVVEYYRLEGQVAHVWIAHQRYPTKGRVWHPGGAHPFIGLNEALVHNGDFANYHAVGEYLKQRNIGQLFLTDTEVSVQLFDLWDRVYDYPLEITLEAMAPTTEFDFEMLPAEKKALYHAIQRTHIHGSPDGPWFFIVARSLIAETDGTEVGDSPHEDRYELIGITDTSMLRPQVFALYENKDCAEPVKIGLIASERQAVNACLRSLASEDTRFQPYADRYWVARGGSHTDGGAFRFTVGVPIKQGQPGAAELSCNNKFGSQVLSPPGSQLDPGQLNPETASQEFRREWQGRALIAFDDGGAGTFWKWLKPSMKTAGWDEIAWGTGWMVEFARSGDDEWLFSLDVLSLLKDRRYGTGSKKRASVLRLIDHELKHLFERAKDEVGQQLHHLDWNHRSDLAGAPDLQQGEVPILLLDVRGFPPEGDQSAARTIVAAFQKGWRWIIAYNWHGGRFAGSGLGASSAGMRLDLFGDVGDYAGSGLDGAEVIIHGDGQDQLGQILKDGKLVIHGDAGQTFLYGAKGGEIFVQGSVAGRPLINAVGRPRTVINGTCLDYLAESFMAGDPLAGGGFVILNGVKFNDNGVLEELETPYPGGNLFSLASGGAIYLRDPHRRVAGEQLNGGVFTPLTVADWELIEPYLQENQRLFGIEIDDLLTVDGVRRSPNDVYRKVKVRGSSVLHETENH